MHRTEKKWLKSEGEDRIKQHSEYRRMRQAYSRGVVKLAKRRFQAQKCSQLESNLGCPKKFWQCIKRMKIRHRKKKVNLLEVLDDDGNVRTCEEAISVWRDYFGRLLGGPGDSLEDNCNDSCCAEKAPKADFSDHLDAPITCEEVLWALTKVKKDAATGPDDVAVQMMLAEPLLEIWLSLFEVCWEYGMWNESLVVPVPKKQTRVLSEANNFCGISLTSTVSKVLSTVMNNRLSSLVEEEGLIAHEQAGFRKHMGCRDQLLTLELLGQLEIAKNPEGMLVAFLDFSKAYDKVDRKTLWTCLHKALYKGSSCRVRVEDRLSEAFTINTGLRQGCVLSPTLFSLYINDVVTTLKEKGYGLQCGSDTIPGLLFADDTGLLAHDEDSLRKSLNCLVEWCEEWGVGINVSKCGIMHMRKKGVVRSKMSYSIGGKDLPLVSNYKYLGCTVDEHLDLDDMVKDKGVDGKKALGAWFQRCNVEMGV